MKKAPISFLLGTASRQLALFFASVVVAAGQVAPSITTQPISQTVTVGGNVTFTVAATFSSVGAFGLTTGSKGAALAVALRQGNYTVQVSGAGGGVGEAIVEIYELP
jgi:Flp pilus assembly protein protease CpaA